MIVIRYAEIALKGGNRPKFENRLMQNMREHLKHAVEARVTKIHGRMIVETDEVDEAVEILKYIPGIANFSIARKTSHETDEIGATALEILKEFKERGGNTQSTFRVDTTRACKQFPMNSMELNRFVAEQVLPVFSDFTIDLRHPELSLGIEVWPDDESILYLEKIQGQGGLPVGASGTVLSLLSGGIDSPVSSWMLMKRGCKVIYLNYDSAPFTSPESKQKVMDLVQHLKRYQPHSKLIYAPFTNIQKEIKKHCREKNRTILYRRMMLRIAERLKEDFKIKAYITGEAVGQVASQTLENMMAIGSIATLPVLRPLVGMEKGEIIELSKKIGSYPISIQPFPDSCTVFQPRKPETHAKISDLEMDESKLDIEGLLDEVVENLEIHSFETAVENQFF